MSGGALGLRTGSYGSLQQHLQSIVVLPIHSPSSGRKQSKMPPSGTREKEKILPWTSRILQCLCRFIPRRKIGMLFLFILCAVMAIVMLGILFSKGGYLSEGPETNHDSRVIIDQVVPFYPVPTLIPGTDEENVNAAPGVDNKSVIYANHPCKNFSFVPPPSDRKRTGPRPCPVCYVPVEHAMAFMPNSPSVSPVLKSLTYVSGEEGTIGDESNRGSTFGGHPSLDQRNDSFNIRESMTVHCGFVKGNRPGNGTGFDINGEDLLEMEQCHGVVVASAIFGNYDIMQQPKNISEAAKKSVCFFMFVDEETEAYVKNSSKLDSKNKVGLWRVVVVRNLPYGDARRNGKVPKLLLHRIFPNARFSLWIDGKLELVVDPYQILERFLWRKNASFAISKHYRRFDVFVEAEANKAAGKYDSATIDYQIEFYKNEGLTPYSEAKLPITSDVPEGCVIIREHNPITNLFTCLWFNEVDRFTSRDQLSFSTVRDKIRSKVNWTVEMFMDCERRNFVVQAYHRDVLEHMMIPAPPPPPPPPPVPTNKSPPLQKILSDRVSRTTVKKPPAKHGREKRAFSRRRRPRITNDRDTNSI